jgi:hypothetical protein
MLAGGAEVSTAPEGKFSDLTSAACGKDGAFPFG